MFDAPPPSGPAPATPAVLGPSPVALTAEALLDAFDAQPAPPLRPFLDMTTHGRVPASVLVHAPAGAQVVTHVLHPATAAALVAEALQLMTDAPADDDRVEMLKTLAVYACVAMHDRVEQSRLAAAETAA